LYYTQKPLLVVALDDNQPLDWAVGFWQKVKVDKSPTKGILSQSILCLTKFLYNDVSMFFMFNKF
jgi:hypothetical protein